MDTIVFPLEEFGSSKSAHPNTEAKLNTISQLKSAEARKPKALSSLKEKLSDFSSDLSNEEKALLGQLIGKNKSEQSVADNGMLTVSRKQAVLPDDKIDQVVFSKPQQVHLPDDDLDQVIFSKPQQVHLPDDELNALFPS